MDGGIKGGLLGGQEETNEFANFYHKKYDHIFKHAEDLKHKAVLRDYA